MSNGHPANQGAQSSADRVEALLARAQRLIDSRSPGEYPVAWCIEASHIGDLTALATVTAAAIRPQ